MGDLLKFESLECLLKEHLAFAKKNFEETGEYTATVIGYTTNNTRIMMPLIFNSDHEKEMILQMMTTVFAAFNVKRYTVANEGYSLRGNSIEEYNKLVKEGKRIKDHPDAIEVLMCTAISYNDTMMHIHEITSDKKLVAVDISGEMKCSGRFAELLPDKNIPSHLRALLRKELEEKGFPIQEETLH